MPVDNNLLNTVDNFTVHIGKEGSKFKVNRNIISFTLPGLTSNEILTPHRNIPIYVPSEVTTTDSLNIRFMCDEKMETYEEIYNWIYDNNGINAELGNTMELKDYEDIIVNIKNSHNNIVKQLQFTNTFPTSVGSVEFTTQGQGEPVYAAFDVALRYDQFNFIKVIDRSLCIDDDSP